MEKIKNTIIRLMEVLQRNRATVLALGCMVVFITTYLLILPAFTLEADKAAEQGGIDVPETILEETSAEEEGSAVQEDQTEAGKNENKSAETAAAGEDSVKEETKKDQNNKEDKEDKEPASAEKKAGSEAKAEAETETSSGEALQFEGKGFSVSVDDTSSVLPGNTKLVVDELLENPTEGTKAERKEQQQAYKDYCDQPITAINDESASQSPKKTISFAKLYDISLQSSGDEITPDKPVNVTISYDQDTSRDLKVVKKADVRIVHFAQDENTGEVTAELLDKDNVDVTLEKSRMTETSFEAESFSVYAVVYTVDFEFSIDGKEYAFSLEGGDSTSFREIIERFEILPKEDIVDFINSIDKVEFSNPKYLWNGKLEEDAFAGDLKKENKLKIQYAPNIRKGNILAMNAHHYSAPDWVLIALKPFDTEETLTVTLKGGEQFTIKVTDDQSDAIHNPDGTVQTIPNPQGTTFELFNYYVDPSTKTTAGRDQWPGHIHHDTDFWMFNWYDLNGNYAASWGDGFNLGYDNDDNYLLGYGNNLGINYNHAFKFSPANAGTVLDGSKGTATKDVPGGSGLNGWTQDADPNQGIVQGTLVGGYPVMTTDSNLGTDGSSLAYLFDNSSQNGKDSYGNVDHLLYVDPEGYYTYDSRDFSATYQSDGTFKVADQPDTDDTEVKGFWPFGTNVYWSGMHMNTQFSMPANGQVLNPKDELKDMQFEFSGDDDTWLYIDGVLVGDGGGIHNRTEIDINFATGKVIVTGEKDDVHRGTFTEEKWLDDIFIAAGRYHDEEWEAIPGTDHKRFKAGTYHTFDMFYLERGGGESNLYIHYNLVSTDDFTGHKSYEGFAEDERMERDQFHFEMIGLDGQYQSVWNPDTQTADVTLVDPNGRAIMPTKGSESGAGTFADPKKVYSESAYIDDSGAVHKGTILTTGVLENGDIRFGSAEISQDEMLACDQGHPSVYHYIIREVVPDDAVNDDGITWAEANEETRHAGGFVKDQVLYDREVYYMTARVTSWQQTGADGNTYTAYGLSKTYYKDDTFTVVDDSVSFVDFRNIYAPDKGEVEFTKLDGTGNPLPGAEFTLYTDSACTKIAKDLGDLEHGITGVDQVKTTGESGVVKFENMAAPRTYYMKETKAPDGYEPNTNVYKVIIESSKDTEKQSRIVMVGDDSETPVTKIYNTKPGEISVIKEWQDQNGNTVSGRDLTARVKLQRKHYQTGSSSTPRTVSFTIQIKNRSDLVYTYTANNVVGGTVTIDWWDTNQQIDSISVNDSSGNSKEYTLSGYWDDVNHKNRKLTINDVFTDLDVVVTYPSDKDWLFNSDHTPWMKDVSVVGSGPSYELVDDEEFNNSTESSHFATLSSPSWAKTWTIGEGKDFPATDGTHPYSYYVVEVDGEGHVISPTVPTGLGYKLIGYSSNNAEGVTDQGVINVYNQLEPAEPVDITIKKFDSADLEDNEAETLKGASFRLEKYTSDTYQEKDENWEEQTLSDNGTGTFNFSDLTEGYYKIVEVATPAGYVRISADPTFEVKLNGRNELEVEFTDTNLVKYTTEGFRFGNEPGSELPHTGGIGTAIFYIFGLLLAAGCGALLLRRTRFNR